MTDTVTLDIAIETEARRAMGVKVLIFLTILGGLVYAVKRKVWADVKH